MMRPAGRLALAAVAVPVAAKALRRLGRSIQNRQATASSVGRKRGTASSVGRKRGDAGMGDMFHRAASGADVFSGRRQSSRYYL